MLHRSRKVDAHDALGEHPVIRSRIEQSLRRIARASLSARIGAVRVSVGAVDLALAPLLILLVRAGYIPLLGGRVPAEAAWPIAAATVGMIALSIAAHSLAHLAAARALGVPMPQPVPRDWRVAE